MSVPYHRLLICILLFLFSTNFTVVSSVVSVGSPTKDSLCNFIAFLYRDFGEFGCCVESPIVELDVCYTSTNLLAEYVLRNVCGRNDLADRIREFLNRYPTDFYDYYQILLLRPFTLPFTTVKHVQVDTVDGIRIVHVRRTDNVVYDYDRYANLIVYKSIYYTIHGQRDKALQELGKLDSLFDGYGFADAAYQSNSKYETYKVALAIILYRIYGFTDTIEKYTTVLSRIRPFTTLYTADNQSNLLGEGDLNLETASITAIALYIDIEYRKIVEEPQLDLAIPIEIVALASISIALIYVLLRLKKIGRFNLGNRN